jgi:Spy/CpxP family protein refolding chaperone
MEVTPMPNRSKLSAVLLLAVVFLAGGAAGWLVRESTGHDRGRGRGPDAMVAYLSRELKLTPAQSDSVRAIFARHRPEIESLWAGVRPRFDSIKTRVRAEIDAQLTPDQRAKHQRLVEDAEHHRRGDSTKAKPEGGRN